ncbi:DNA-binding response regulator [Marivirga tractuosa]|uniref:Two component transcriptional regulator, LytTR family n=1 Tax=Marivirga tractuosa (strain ATCC 23168 / DSM 4126 / NBRC 15989 / NCIMB 1408 / VKM B-1430 / H-43) TaxID=643867 RepID=E4TM57_MARTH|nr:LytTR family transcriptional regulator DNA-binding domain-containing protein [Marivirga tractuosa]ADR21333.1 two component transcriptional regulator, LytTR family [Marivirga tractuosa DSM 4126]BDD14213.1 DNA-binding response regulator [Marivirga tractuosa]
MIRTIIIDDEPLAAGIVQEYLAECKDFEILAICHDGFEGLKAIQQHRPDLIFLDVQMPKISGFEMLELLDELPAVIFTTAFDEYALQAFEVHAIDYLLKPFSQDRFKKAINKYKQSGLAQNVEGLLQNELIDAKEYLSRIVLKDRNDIKIIPTNDINYMEANDDYVNIYTKEGKYLKNKTLSYFERNLDPEEFVRVHRSYVAKIAEITKIEAYKKDSHILILKSGEQIPVSKTGYPKLKAALGI